MTPYYFLVAVVVGILLTALLSRRGSTVFECKKCHSMNNYLTTGGIYQDCVGEDEYLEDLARRIADRAKSDPNYTPYN